MVITFDLSVIAPNLGDYKLVVNVIVFLSQWDKKSDHTDDEFVIIPIHLTHWGQGKKSRCFLLWTTSLNALFIDFFILMAISLKFVLPGSIGLGCGLVPNRRQAIIWANGDAVYWRIYAPPDFDDTLHGSSAGLILGLRPANERRRYKVTPSLIGWAQT